jgi:hypothetical protein
LNDDGARRYDASIVDDPIPESRRRHRPHAPGRVLAVAVAMLLGGLVSCATWQNDAGGAGVAAGAGASTIASPLRPGGDHGLQVLHWTISVPADELITAFDQSAGRLRVERTLQRRIAAALLRYQDGQALGEPTRARWERNGLRVIRVRLEVLDSLRADLGRLTREFDAWHGQAVEWRSLVEGPIADAGTAVAVDGRVRRYAGGRIHLMLRGWTLLMETGPELYVELASEYRRSRAGPIGQLLGRRNVDRDRFASLAVDLELEPGYAYVIASAAPGEEWTADAFGPGAGEVTPNDETSTGELEARSDAGSEESVESGLGPAVTAPLTIGELLLCPETGRPQRELILLVPRIPDALFPPERAAAAGTP